MATFRDPKSGQQFTVPDDVIDDYTPAPVADDAPAPEEPAQARTQRRRRKAR